MLKWINCMFPLSVLLVLPHQTSHSTPNLITLSYSGSLHVFLLCLENMCPISPRKNLAILMTQLKGPFIQKAFHEHFLLWVPKAS